MPVRRHPFLRDTDCATRNVYAVAVSERDARQTETPGGQRDGDTTAARVKGIAKGEHASPPGIDDSSAMRADARRSPEPQEMRVAIGIRLRDARRAAGLTQQQVVDGIGRRKSWLAKLELGQRSLLFSEAVTLADAYGVGLADLWPPDLRAPRDATGLTVRAEATDTSRLDAAGEA
jgi:ribosome-binding protein aMBF1 (putative translation factor)